MKYWNMRGVIWGVEREGAQMKGVALGNGTLWLFYVVVTHCYCYFNNLNRTAMAFSAAALQI